MHRLLVIPLALVALLMGALAWSGGGGQRRADFAFINRGDIYTLDLNQMSYMQDFRLTYGIREGLYSPDPQTYRPIPAGAVSYDLSPDKKTWTFHLRPEARWSNGDPVTAADYVFSWRTETSRGVLDAVQATLNGALPDYRELLRREGLDLVGRVEVFD